MASAADGAMASGAADAPREGLEAPSIASARPKPGDAAAGNDPRSVEVGALGGAISARASADAVGGSAPARSSGRRERAARQRFARKALAKEQVVASKPSELRRDEPLQAAEAPPAGALDGLPAAPADLDSEVRLVDDMHGAARRNDREALGRFVDRYRTTFPDGQLKKEVAEFAARLERADVSIAP
jgi:hypothetical protein